MKKIGVRSNSESFERQLVKVNVAPLSGLNHRQRWYNSNVTKGLCFFSVRALDLGFWSDVESKEKKICTHLQFTKSPDLWLKLSTPCWNETAFLLMEWQGRSPVNKPFVIGWTCSSKVYLATCWKTFPFEWPLYLPVGFWYVLLFFCCGCCSSRTFQISARHCYHLNHPDFTRNKIAVHLTGCFDMIDDPVEKAFFLVGM